MTRSAGLYLDLKIAAGGPSQCTSPHSKYLLKANQPKGWDAKLRTFLGSSASAVKAGANSRNANLGKPRDAKPRALK
jgi:hypothetical protein